MEKPKKINYFKLKKMDLKDVEQYYRKLRNCEYTNKIPIKNLKIKKIIHPLPYVLVKLDRIISKEKLKVIKDERIKSNRPKIYACTHIGGNDVQRTFEGIKEHAYLFLGDPRELYTDVTGIIMKMNGAICFETNDKIDRKIAYNRSIELLNKGGNLLIYPEGAWNITPNLPTMKLYPGTIRMAKETKADIIPVAIEEYRKKFYVNIGKNIKYEEIKDKTDEEANNELRDKMATLKWQIWERQIKEKRKNFKEGYEEQFVSDIISKCPYGFTEEDVRHDMYKPKNEANPEDAYIVSPKEIFQKRKKLERY